MAIKSKWQAAEELYNRGSFLYRENRFEQALIELRRAADTFRKLDAGGNVFNRYLSNGVTGHAGALALAGQCHVRLGEIEQAIPCFESILINEQSERPGPFHELLNAVRLDSITCYETIMRQRDPGLPPPGAVPDAGLDTSCRFPYSLPPELIPPARLFELAPERYECYREFYHRFKERDRELRRSDKDINGDGALMFRATLSIWTILGSLWALYTIIVFKALFPNALRAVPAP